MADQNFLAGYIGSLAKKQEARLKALPNRTPIAPSEQLQRFLTGAERWRVDAGLVTPEEFGQYEQEMIKRLQEQAGR